MFWTKKQRAEHVAKKVGQYLIDMYGLKFSEEEKRKAFFNELYNIVFEELEFIKIAEKDLQPFSY